MPGNPGIRPHDHLYFAPHLTSRRRLRSRPNISNRSIGVDSDGFPVQLCDPLAVTVVWDRETNIEACRIW